MSSAKKHDTHLFGPDGLSVMSRKHLEAEIERLTKRNEALERQVQALVRRQSITDPPDEHRPTLH